MENDRIEPREQRRRLSRASVLAVASVLGCSASGGSTHRQFVAVHNAFEALGLSQVGHIAEGSLGEGGALRFPTDLEAQCYAFVAFGGDGTRDVDLQITDANNNRVAADTSHDSQAAVQYCAPTRGRYTLTLRMAAGSGSYTLSSWRGAVHGGGSAGNVASSGDTDGPGTCQNPIPIQLGQTLTGDTRHAHNNFSPPCVQGEGEAPENVYALQVERRQQITAAAEQDYDGTLYIRTSCDESQASDVPGACNDDDADTHHSRVITVLEPGTYYIFADGYGANRGSYTLTVTGADIPTPEEACQNASTLQPGVAVTGQLSGDPNVFQATCGSSNALGPDHVYQLDVPQESRLQVFQETDYEGVVYVRRACANADSMVACGVRSDDPQHARVNATVPAGTYFVFTDATAAAASGNFTLEADVAPVAGGGGVPGDACADAVPLTSGQVAEGNTFQAHDDVHSPCAAAQDGYDLVYRLNVAARSQVRLWFEGNDLGNDAVIYLTRNCTQPTTANSIVCHAGAITADSAVEAVVDRGDYWVVVDSARPRAFGRFRLMAHVEDLTALDRACRQAPLLRSGQTVTGATHGDDRFQSTCAGNSRSPEDLYRLVVRRPSMVRLAVSTTGGYDSSLYVRRTCTDPSTEAACNDDAPDTQHSVIEQVFQPGTYTVFVDGYSNHNSGSYTLETTISPR